MDSMNSRPTQADDPTYCSFEVGQHVVCIKCEPERYGESILGPVTYPTVGQVYTVLRVSADSIMRNPGLVLAEIGEQKVRVRVFNRILSLNVLFCHTWFRPLQRLKVDDFLTADAPKEVEPA